MTPYRVSPGLTLRPSLSVAASAVEPGSPVCVSPGLTLRPSLSAHGGHHAPSGR